MLIIIITNIKKKTTISSLISRLRDRRTHAPATRNYRTGSHHVVLQLASLIRMPGILTVVHISVLRFCACCLTYHGS
jgi:hypothetical protein